MRTGFVGRHQRHGHTRQEQQNGEDGCGLSRTHFGTVEVRALRYSAPWRALHWILNAEVAETRRTAEFIRVRVLSVWIPFSGLSHQRLLTLGRFVIGKQRIHRGGDRRGHCM